MSVGLGTLDPKDKDFFVVEVYSTNYDGDFIELEETTNDGKEGDRILLNKRQMQELSVIIDRFLS